MSEGGFARAFVGLSQDAAPWLFLGQILLVKRAIPYFELALGAEFWCWRFVESLNFTGGRAK